ncbi:MAG: hypothetical protein AAFR61_04835 [Bacteroidota bacterium]
MNHFRNIAVGFAVMWVACDSPPPPVELIPVPIGNLYQVDLPSNLQPGYDMHAYASLQYYDTLSNFYILGIEDDKANLGEIKRLRLKLRGYFQFVEGTVFGRVDSLLKESTLEYSFNDDLRVLSGDYYVYNRKWGDDPVFYRLSVYETQDYFFQIVCWMPYNSHCEAYERLDGITYSFSLIPDKAGTTAGLR